MEVDATWEGYWVQLIALHEQAVLGKRAQGWPLAAPRNTRGRLASMETRTPTSLLAK